MSDRLHLAADHYRAGRYPEAAQLLLAHLQAAPEDPDALNLMGMTAWRLGHPEEGLSLVSRALALDPRHVPAQANQGVLLQRLGRLEEAERALSRALRLRADLPQASLALGQVRADRGDLAGAEAALAALRRPDHADALALRGRVALRRGLGEVALRHLEAAKQAGADGTEPDVAAALLLLGRAAEALPLLEQALAANSAAGESWARLGMARMQLGDQEAALHALSEARHRLPEDATLAHTMGLLRLERGDRAGALAAMADAVRLAPTTQEHLVGLADAALLHPHLPAELNPLLAGALALPDLDAQRLEQAIRRQLSDLPAVRRALEGDLQALPALVDTLAAHPLVPGWLSRSIVVDPAWEGLFVQLRRQLLERAIAAPAPLVEALAMQAWHTEYAWESSAQEEALLAALPSGLETIAALYRPVRPDGTADLVAASLGAEAEEARLALAITELQAGDDPTSAQVRAQYEANPYPRLVALHRRPARPLASLLPRLLPRAALPPLPQGPIRILIAGCGTGQHPLATATRYQDADVLAIDLSRRSLARAARVAAAHGVGNLRFARADLLALDDALGPFDLIESGGVLHHLADPMAGWARLRALLRPGGLMRIGLYSERARADVRAARALAHTEGWTTEPAGIRAARQRIRALPPGHAARDLLGSIDFYSLSGARDLFLHACEHRFTPLQLAEMIRALDLRFLGFQHQDPEATHLYRERWPEDLAQADLSRWEALEIDRPHLFKGMLVAWCADARPVP